MHTVVMESLEEYLAGALDRAHRLRIEAHLTQCESCRGEVAAMEDVSLLFQGLRSANPPEPALGFSARVMAHAAESRSGSGFGELVAMNLLFGRRLAFACLLTMAVLGSFLVWRETAYESGASPEAIMAQQEMPAFSQAPGRDAMLVTLTSYEH
jgi:predicted anti-sigma-YlaC factor YlaD